MIKPWMKPYLKYSSRTITSRDIETNENLRKFIRVRSIIFILNPIIAAVLLAIVAIGVI